MKKKLNATLFIILLLLVAFIAVYLFKQDLRTITVPSTGEVCEMIEGVRLPEYNECENISEERCELEHGEFNPCASACRHEEEATICTMQCIQVCTLPIN